MATSTSTRTYAPEVLQSVGRCIAAWNRDYLRGRRSRGEHFAAKEFRLLMQYLFTRQDPNPLDPNPELLRNWLELARGLDVYGVRLTILDRLHRLTGSPAFRLDGLPPRPSFTYPDRDHLIRYRRYHRSIYERSRPCFEAITPDRIIESEWKSRPYPEALACAGDAAAEEGPNCFEDSWRHVAAFLEAELSDRPRPHRILDVGCGHAGLIALLRKGPFPDATLVGTNLFGTAGIRPEVLDDPNIEIVATRAEELPFEPESFDAVVCTEVIEHLFRPHELVEQIARVLKPGGAFIVTAPSLHIQFLAPNPLTYVEGLLSLVDERVLPPFHHLYEPLTDLPLIHYAFSVKGFERLFRPYLPGVRVSTMRFPHLRKFRLEALAHRIPLLRRFGALVMAHGRRSSQGLPPPRTSLF
jgi:SAM-dependent methyltransferase